MRVRKIFNNRDETHKRQSLRTAMPVAERLRWKHLRNQTLGVKFRRQFSIGPTIVDLGCPSKVMAPRTRVSRGTLTKQVTVKDDGASHAGESATPKQAAL